MTYGVLYLDCVQLVRAYYSFWVQPQKRQSNNLFLKQKFKLLHALIFECNKYLRTVVFVLH